MADVYDFAAARLLDDWKSAIEFFWDGFAKHADAIDRYYTHGDEAIDPIQTTIALLKALPIELTWEYGPGVEERHQLAFSSELNADALVLVRAVMNRAPDLPRWSFTDARLPERDPEMVRQLIANRTFEDRLSISDVSFSEGRDRTIDVASHAINPKVDAGLAAGQGELFLSVWLGETLERIWLGDFGSDQVVFPRKKLLGFSKNPEGIDVQDVGERLDATVAELAAQASEKPWSSIDLQNAEWSSLKGNSSAGEDTNWRNDTIAGVSAYPAVTLASLKGGRFRSERFSRYGETFCFLKIDGSQDDAIGRFEDRGELEDSLNDRLQSRSLGAAFGGGTGRRYSYIDLALVDLETSIEAVSSLLWEAGLTRSTWLHFNDDGLSDFWLPIWPDAPAPPLDTRH